MLQVFEKEKERLAKQSADGNPDATATTRAITPTKPSKTPINLTTNDATSRVTPEQPQQAEQQAATNAVQPQDLHSTSTLVSAESLQRRKERLAQEYLSLNIDVEDEEIRNEGGLYVPDSDDSDISTDSEYHSGASDNDEPVFDDDDDNDDDNDALAFYDKKLDAASASLSTVPLRVLLAQAWNAEQVDPTGWWMSEKIDGLRAYWSGTHLMSRNGNRFNAPAWFTKDLPANVALDGELSAGRGMFQRSLSIISKATPDSEQWKQIRYYIFDLPCSTAPFEQRIESLQALFTAATSTSAAEHQQPSSSPPTHITLVDQTRCNGPEHLQQTLANIEALNGEGVMLRKPHSLYERKRSPTLLKVKSIQDAEAKVVGYFQSADKSVTGAISSLECEMPNGKRFFVASGLSNKLLQTPPCVGSIINYKYQGVTDAGLPRFPRFGYIRTDIDYSQQQAEAATKSSGTVDQPQEATHVKPDDSNNSSDTSNSDDNKRSTEDCVEQAPQQAVPCADDTPTSQVAPLVVEQQVPNTTESTTE
jgi:hypothetical protein